MDVSTIMVKNISIDYQQ